MWFTKMGPCRDRIAPPHLILDWSLIRKEKTEGYREDSYGRDTGRHWGDSAISQEESGAPRSHVSLQLVEACKNC